MSQEENIENSNKAWILFSLKYFFAFLMLFVTKLNMTLYVKHKIIRPFDGDVLVVILIYCFAKAFINASSLYIAIGVLLFAYSIEIFEYYNFVEVLQL